MKPRTPRQKSCRVCASRFVPLRPFQVACTIGCAIAYAEAERRRAERRAAKAERKEDQIKRESLKTRAEYMREAQAAFNSFIRARDADKPCICCGLPLGAGDLGGLYDCGHYRSTGSAPHLRFDERNAHAQRKQCNRWGAGRAVDYRIGLIARIGLQAVEELEADQEPRKFSIDDLRAIKTLYNAKRRALLKEREAA